MTSETWRWLSYREPWWVWAVDEIGSDYFEDEDALEQAIFAVAVRLALQVLQRSFPERRLLRLCNELRHAVEDVQADLVAEVRSEGVSWTRVGTALGVGRTAAQKRYGHGLPQLRRDQLELEAQAVMDLLSDLVTESLDEESDDVVAEAQEFLDRIMERRRTAG